MRVGGDENETIAPALEHFFDGGGTDRRLLGSERSADETEQTTHTRFPHQRRELLGVSAYLGFEGARKAARHDLSRLLTAKDEQDTDAEYLLRASGMSGPGDAIVACARELEVELIVMGKHHLGFVEHMLAGSVAEKVVRHAPCPVLIVQHPEHDFVVAEPRHVTVARK